VARHLAATMPKSTGRRRVVLRKIPNSWKIDFHLLEIQ